MLVDSLQQDWPYLVPLVLEVLIGASPYKCKAGCVLFLIDPWRRRQVLVQAYEKDWPYLVPKISEVLTSANPQDSYYLFV